MYVFTEYFQVMLVDGVMYAFILFYAYVWALSLFRIFVSSRYRPYRNRFYEKTTVIIPVVDEDWSLFQSVLGSMVYGYVKPEQIIVVINGKRDASLEAASRKFGDLVEYVWTDTPGKRNAILLGLARTKHPITVLVDSDTIWTMNTLGELIKPFADPEVGGVSTKQKLYNGAETEIARFAEIMEDLRNNLSSKVQSTLGSVACLPGRTIAFRTKILLDTADKFMSDKFLGITLEVSDDRTLTNYALKEGYKTVYQDTSVVYTSTPVKFKRWVKQQLRWARGSQYNNLRMLTFYLRHHPHLAFFTLNETFVPFFSVALLLTWIFNFLLGNSTLIIEHDLFTTFFIFSVSLAASFFIRLSAIIEDKGNFMMRIFHFVFIVLLVLTPIRLYGFFTMANGKGWGTRKGAFSDQEIVSYKQFLPALIGSGLLIILTLIAINPIHF